MVFKLLIEIDEKGNIEVSNEGKISPIIILGALRKIEHDLLMTSMLMDNEKLQEELGEIKEEDKHA